MKISVKRSLLLNAVLVVAILLAACTSSTKDKDDTNVQVVTSFDAITEYVKAIGGERVNVRSLVPAGAAAHGFQPKAQDLVVLQDADLFIINGLQMEPWAEQAAASVSNDKLSVIDTSKGVSTIAIGETDGEDEHEHEADDHAHEEEDDHDHDHDDHDHGAEDPHIWLGLTSAKKQVENVRDALIAVDQEGAEFYTENATRFNAALDALLAEYKPQFAALDSDVFVTGHAAFAYLCRDLGLTQLSVQSVFAEGEPSAKQLIDLVEFSREHKVKTIFAESMASPEVSRTLAAEVGANVETIYTMEAAEDELSYLARVEANLAKILEALRK